MPKKGEHVYHRKDGLWEARYVKEIDAYGKRKYGSVYAHTCREAKEKRQEMIDTIRLFQKPTTARNVTVAQLANEYLYVNQHRIKPSTYQRYSGYLNNHLIHMGGQPILYVTTSVINEFAMSRLHIGMAPQTINVILAFLHACLKYGQRQYNLPMPEIIYLSTCKKEMRVFSKEEQQSLVRYLNKDTDIYKFGVLLTLYTGLRIGELCGLKWEDINDKSIKVRRSIQRLQIPNKQTTELYIGTPKTDASIREIPIPSFLKNIIKSFKIKNDGYEYLLGTKRVPIAEPRIMQIKFRQYLNEIGIEGATFHTLRHTFATRCVECGFEVKSLSEILGHTNVQITLNRYVHSSFELKANNMEKLSLLL